MVYHGYMCYNVGNCHQPTIWGWLISPIEMVTSSPQAETAERLTRAELDVATSRRAELECQASAAQSEADSARTLGGWVDRRSGVDSARIYLGSVSEHPQITFPIYP